MASRGVKRRTLCGQKTRREETLRRQKSQRQDAAMRARLLVEGGAGAAAAAAASEHTLGEVAIAGGAEAMSAVGGAVAEGLEEAEGGAAAPVTEARGSGAAGDGRARRRRPAVDLYRSELMVPEWMVGVPDDLATQWFVIPRPQGKRCLVVANAGAATCRMRNGSRVEPRFQSHIPGGGRTAGHSSGHYTILDCILHQPDNTYYVVDCMCWNGHAMYDCATEFRLFWLQSKLGEVGANVLGPNNARRFLPLPCYAASPDGIAAAYGEQFGFTKDCLLFLSKETTYQPGVTPLALLWKDAHTSEYFIESRSAHEQISTLVLGPGGELLTSDEPPMTIGQLPPDVLAAQQGTAAALQPGDPVRCAIKQLVLSADGEEVVGAQAEFRGHGGKARAGADSWSKIIFQYHARTQPLTIVELVNEAVGDGADPAAAAAAAALGSRLTRVGEFAGAGVPSSDDVAEVTMDGGGEPEQPMHQ